MLHPPPNRNQLHPPQYFQQLALRTSLGDETSVHKHQLKRSRIALDRNALISLAIIFIVVLITVTLLGFYKSHPDIKDLPNTAKAQTEKTAVKNEVENSDEKMLHKTDSTQDTAEQDGKILVYVSGAVAKPGVVTLEQSSRVNDAIQAAGGGLEEADLIRINLAQVIHDGEQIHVPKIGDISDSTELIPGVQGGRPRDIADLNQAENLENGLAETTAKLNLNRASAAQLEEIPGIGPVMAQEIISWRKENGPFKNIEDLLQISGIGEKILAKIRPHVSL